MARKPTAASIAALVAAVALTATGVAAAAAPRYTGPRYGVPFDVRLSGSVTRTWTITEKPFACEPAGGGTQTVRFATPGVAHARFASVESHSPRAHFYQVLMDLPLTITVDREDDTQLVPPPAGESCEPAPPKVCGEHAITMTGFELASEKHRLRLALQRSVAGQVDDAVDELYARGSNCLFPMVEDVVAARVRWPGNQKAFRPGRHLRYTVTAPPTTRRSWVISSDDPDTLFHTSEQVGATFTVDLRNRCRPVPKRLRRSVGYSCDAENGTIPVR